MLAKKKNMQIIKNYFDNNSLLLNLSKSKFIIFSINNIIDNHSYKINIHYYNLFRSQ